ncbi:MAG: PIN domain-containing protein, partial [Verrucomicrobia bacterium]|nr:PIN domain-containing protein [Verrucomicrobiota bacterium]
LPSVETRAKTEVDIQETISYFNRKTVQPMGGSSLYRPQFNIDPQKGAVLIGYIQASAETHTTVPLRRSLPDEDDNSFMEVALSSGAKSLVTGNLRYFPERCREGVRALASREFLDFFRRRRTSI